MDAQVRVKNEYTKGIIARIPLRHPIPFIISYYILSRNTSINANLVVAEVSGLKLIVKELLQKKHMSLRALADKMPGGAPSYRTLEEFVKRRSGTLSTASAVARAMGLGLDDIYVDDGYEIPTEYSEEMQMPADDCRLSDSNNSEKLYESLIEFAGEGETEAHEAAERAAEALRNAIFEFNKQCRFFLTADAEQINALEEKEIADFINCCERANAVQDIKRITEIYTKENFGLKQGKMVLFGVLLGRTSFLSESKMFFEELERCQLK